MVWDLVTDIDLPARFSDEFQGATWDGEGAALGASFTGRNRHPAIGEWELRCYINVYEEQAGFGWATMDPDDPGARWCFDLEPMPGGTRLRYSVVLGPGPSGTTAAIAAMPEKEDRILHRRIGELNANMGRTVEGIKTLAEERANATQS